MSQTSPTLALPYLQASQAQKHVTHNEALRILDAATQLSVLAADLTEPPAAPNEGDVYIPAPGPSGDWAGHGGDIAVYVEGAWQFFEAAQGWRADVAPTGQTLRFDGSVWEAPVPELQNLPELGVNTTADTTNKLAVASDATLLTHDGDDHQLKVNKAATADTASLLFQTGFSGRAEMGTAGSDDFAIKVSSDGSNFETALTTDGDTGLTTVKKRFFAVGLSAPQTGVPDATHTPITFDLASANDSSMFDTTTARLTPPAGAISAIAGTYASNLTPGSICSLGVWKNGVMMTQKVYYAAAGGDIGMDAGLQDVCSGSDYYEVVVYIRTSTGGTLNNLLANTYFRGFHH